MKKVFRLIEEYIYSINEQDDTEVNTDDTRDSVSSNEKYVIKILANALIFNPAKFESKRDQIISDIEEIRKSVNQPIARTVQQIKDIISLDRSLVIERETGRLFDYYTELLERNSLDATEPQSDGENVSITPPNVNDVDPEIDVELDEIFPMYVDLILNALSFQPTSRDLISLKDVVSGAGEVDPLAVVDVVQGIMASQRSEDDIKQDLTEI